MKVGLGAAREELMMNERQDDIILSFQGPDVGAQTPELFGR